MKGKDQVTDLGIMQSPQQSVVVGRQVSYRPYLGLSALCYRYSNCVNPKVMFNAVQDQYSCFRNRHTCRRPLTN